jgi:hypothetical protein
MLLAIVVVFNGVFAPSAPPVIRLHGHVLAPLGAIVSRIADRVTIDGATLTLVRGAHTCVFRIGAATYRCDAAIRVADVAPVARDGTAFLPLATVVRAFGGAATYDALRGAFAITLPPDRSLVTPPPFDPSAPQAMPTQVFTPQPPPPTPQVIQSGDPRPRRTAIPATPSRVPVERAFTIPCCRAPETNVA